MHTIEQSLRQEVTGNNALSVQYLFFDTDSIVFSYREGIRDMKTGAKVDAGTRYHLYSVTKTFTALAVMQLVDEGKVRLDRPAIDYLPEFPYSAGITVEQLLSHTAGIPNPLPLRWIHLAGEHEGFNHDAFYRDIFRKHPKLEFEPGTSFKYSNLGYVLLGQLIEQVSGVSFDQYVNRHIVEPAGIGHRELNFEIDPANHAVGYQKWFTPTNALLTFMIDKKKFMGEKQNGWVPFNPFYNNGVAYGGMFGTPDALARYGQALLKADSPLLSNSGLDVLFREAVVNGKSTGMAHSWFTGSLKGNRYLAHAGGGGGYYLELRLYPELGVGSVVVFNRTGVRDERILDKWDKSFLSDRRMD